MTETSPLASISRLPSTGPDRDSDEAYALRATPGRRSCRCVEFRIDEESGGELQVRGSTIASLATTTTRRAPPSSPRTAGCAPATSRSSGTARSSSSSTARRTWSSPAASGSARSSSRTRSWPTPRCSRRRSSRCRTSAGASVRAPASCSQEGSELDAEACRSSSAPRVAKWWLPDRVAVHRRGAEDLGRQVRQEGAAGAARRRRALSDRLRRWTTAARALRCESCRVASSMPPD